MQTPTETETEIETGGTGSGDYYEKYRKYKAEYLALKAKVGPLSAGTMEDVVIIGGGPAGHTAGIYTGRAELRTVLYEGSFQYGHTAGGQLMMTTDIENYPGFPEGISGYDLMERFRAQSQRFGVRVMAKTVKSVDLTRFPLVLTVEGDGEAEETVLARSVIIASGATAKRLGVINEDKFWLTGGISACAVCDGALPMYRNKPIAVVGGGDSAMEEALFLSRYASRVYLIHRSSTFRASKIMLNRVKQNVKIEIVTDTVVKEAYGGADPTLLDRIRITTQTPTEHKEWYLMVNGLFYAIGHTPNTSLFKGQLDVDADGYIRTEPGSTRTNVAGVFACGDVQDKRYRQAVTSAGTGCMASLDAERWLESLHG